MPKHREVSRYEAGQRLDRYIADVFPEISRRKARELIAKGYIWLNGHPVRILSRRLKRGDRITWFDEEIESSAPPSEGEESRSIRWERYGGKPGFLYRDHFLAIAEKPAGLPTEPTPREDVKTLKRQIEALLREEGLHPKRIYVTAVHRLDAAASGAVAFALKKTAARELSRQFAERRTRRTYRALVAGIPREKSGELRHYIGWTGPGVRHGVLPPSKGKLAVLTYRVIEEFSDASILEIQLKTGRTHQIRVQMAAVGHPLLGDWLYMPRDLAARYPSASRLMLHAYYLKLYHPEDGRPLEVRSPYPPDFSDFLRDIRRRG